MRLMASALVTPSFMISIKISEEQAIEQWGNLSLLSFFLSLLYKEDYTYIITYVFF